MEFCVCNISICVRWKMKKKNIWTCFLLLLYGSFLSASFVHWQTATCYGNMHVCVYCICPCVCVCVNVLSFQSYAASIRFIQLGFYFHVNRLFFPVKLSCDYFAVLSFIVSLFCFIYTYFFLYIVLYAYTYLDCVWCCFLMAFETRNHFSLILSVQNQDLGIEITILRKEKCAKIERASEIEDEPSDNMHKCIWY